MNIEDPRPPRRQRYDTILWALATAWLIWLYAQDWLTAGLQALPLP